MRESPCLRAKTLPSDNPVLTGLKLELAYFSGVSWLRGRYLAVPACAPAAAAAVSAPEIPRDHAGISRPDDPGAETLEIRHRLDGRSLPKGGHDGQAAALRVPDLRRGLQGRRHLSLSRAVEAWRALHGLCADGFS